jgi:hypothetical protein
MGPAKEMNGLKDKGVLDKEYATNSLPTARVMFLKNTVVSRIKKL